MLRQLRADGYEVLFVPVNPPSRAACAGCAGCPTRARCSTRCPTCRASRAFGTWTSPRLLASYWSFVVSPLPAILVARLFGTRVCSTTAAARRTTTSATGAPSSPVAQAGARHVVPRQFPSEVFGRHGYCTEISQRRGDRPLRYRERLPVRRLGGVGAQLLSPSTVSPKRWRPSARRARYPEARSRSPVRQRRVRGMRRSSPPGTSGCHLPRAT